MSEKREFLCKSSFQAMVLITGFAVIWSALQWGFGDCYRWGVDPLW